MSDSPFHNLSELQYTFFNKNKLLIYIEKGTLQTLDYSLVN